MTSPADTMPLSRPAARWSVRATLRRLRRYPLIPIVILSAVAVSAFAGDWIMPHDPNYNDLLLRLRPPFWEEGGTTTYLLGTDQLGRDVVSRLIAGARVTLIVASLSIGISAVVGSMLGMVAGYFGGFADALIMRIVDYQIAVPTLLFGIMLAAVLGPSLQNVILILVFFTWYPFARIVRAEVLSLRERDFVTLARVGGAGWAWIFWKHLLPNTLSTVIVVATLQVSVAIIVESSLSFLGLGIQAPDISWGQMLSEGRSYILVAWWLITWPGFAIFLVALSGNLFGDWLRDVLDPRLQATR